MTALAGANWTLVSNPETQFDHILFMTALAGANWTLVTKTPGFSPRSGHGVVVTDKGQKLVLLAGWPELHDAWASTDGAHWTLQGNSTCASYLHRAGLACCARGVTVRGDLPLVLLDCVWRLEHVHRAR